MDFLPDAPICREDMRLLEDFATTTEAYFDAVKKLREATGEVAMFEAYELAEFSRRDCAAAREAVQRHRKEHGCRVLILPAKA
jgi:hypothetical protein